jgi:para-nitrobenzyl esterase
VESIFRRWVKQLVVGVLAGLLLQAGMAGGQAQTVERPPADGPVRIEQGRVAGKMLASGVQAYLGLPYAAPPVGSLRWRPPEAPAAWEGTYHADRFAPQCPQVLHRRDLNHFFGEEPTSENCLFLNIWAPGRVSPQAKLPVIVFVHGGGFTMGSSGMALYGGENLAREGAVFVSMNYRLGALGFMAHPGLAAESPRQASGNYGLMDIAAALGWVKRNIAAFGGDPDNVTLSGQSAGAYAIAYLQVSPLGTGLFQKGVALSGSTFGNSAPGQTRDEAEAAGLAVQAATGAASLAELRQLAPDKIIPVQRDCQLGCAGSVRIGPSIDGFVVPAEPGSIFASGRQSDIPLLLSMTRDESSNPLRTAGSVLAYREAATKLYGERAEAFLRLYPAGTDAEARAMGLAAAREGMIGHQMRAWAQVQVAHGRAPVYLAMFSRVHPFAPGVTFYDNPQAIGAYHTADVPYWLQTQAALNMFRTTRNWGEEDRQLSRSMMDSLLAFARTGEPSTPAQPWDRWIPGQEQLMEFGDQVGLRPMEVERLNFHAAADAIQATPRLSRD